MRGQSDMTGSGCGRITLSSGSHHGKDVCAMWAPSVGGAVVLKLTES